MKVLVCDDDAASRFVARRMLEDHFRCEVFECGDGVEALEAMARQKFSFILLDYEMPGMNGAETLEEIRESPTTRDVPVIILSRERAEANIVKLVRLGISDYILKPLRSDVAVSKIAKVIAMLPREAAGAIELDRIRLGGDTPALLIDGNLDYRYFFVSQLERFGRVFHADSGAAAVSLCRKSIFRLIFVGGDLGVISAGRVAQRLRELYPSDLRLIQIVDGAVTLESGSLFDAAIRRTYAPVAFQAQLRPFLFIPGPFSALIELVPELPNITASAATQVFGMMFDAEIVASNESGPLDVAFSSTLEIVLDDRFVIRIGVHLPKAAALAAGSKMAGVPASELQDEDCLSLAGELGNILLGRVHARFEERKMKSVASLPDSVQGSAFPSPDEASGILQRFAMPDAGEFLISVSVSDRLGETRPVASARADSKAPEHA
jgi:CheY-like chemotaxis protein